MKKDRNLAPFTVLEITVDAEHHAQAIRLAFKDLRNSFEFVEPHNKNVNVFSHRFFELLLRGCTEYESISKTVLNAIGKKVPVKANIGTYFQLRGLLNLDSYFLYIPSWNPSAIRVTPFEDKFVNNNTFTWYEAYNEVKHSRAEKFASASMANAIHSIGASFLLLSIAYGTKLFLWKDDGLSANFDDQTITIIPDLDVGIGYMHQTRISE